MASTRGKVNNGEVNLYEIERDANIARNKEFMRSLNLPQSTLLWGVKQAHDINQKIAKVIYIFLSCHISCL